MQARNTARRVLRSDTAPVRQQLDGNLRSTEHQRIDSLESRLEETHEDLRVFGNNINATNDNMNSGIRAEMAALNETVVGLVQSVSNLLQGLNQVQQMAQEAYHLAESATQSPSERATPTPARTAAAVPSWGTSGHSATQQVPSGGSRGAATNDARSPTGGGENGPGNLHLRKMDVKPPVLVGDIDGIKLNSFIFQFESYFQQKGYDLLRHDYQLGRELNQCVQKNALVWYERYMTDDSTIKLWSAMKMDLDIQFKEPNFQDKIRNQLLTMKQTGGYIGYVGKFRELNRIAKLDSLTAMNLFLNGLADAAMKREILRKKPQDMNSAIQEGFLKWELKEKTSSTNRPSEKKNKIRDTRGGQHQQASHPCQGARRITNNNRSGSSRAANEPNCSFCGRGPHKVEDCWFKFPEKRPSLCEIV